MPHIILPFWTNAYFPNQNYPLENVLMYTTNSFPIAYAHYTTVNIVNMQSSKFVHQIAQSHQHEVNLYVVATTTSIRLLPFAHPPQLEPLKCPLVHITIWMNFCKAQEETSLQKLQRCTTGIIRTLICKPCNKCTNKTRCRESIITMYKLIHM